MMCAALPSGTSHVAQRPPSSSPLSSLHAPCAFHLRTVWSAEAQLVIRPNELAVDGRTTVKVMNIPRKASAKLFLALLDAMHAGKYDVVFFPLDFEHKQNFGMAYVNLVDASLVWSLYGALHGRAWEQFPFEAPMYLQFSELQGAEALYAHFSTAR